MRAKSNQARKIVTKGTDLELRSQIECVRVFGLRYPLPEPLVLLHRLQTHTEAVLVQIVDSTGAEGWGECYGPMELVIPAVTQFYASALIGKDPLSFAGLWEVLWAESYWWARRGILLSALSGLDMALWDLAGQLVQRSVSEMMGGRYRDRLPCYATGLYFRERPEAEYIPTLVEEAQQYVEEGYRAVKVQLGRNPFSDRALISALRSALPRTPLIADACCAYDLPEALQIGRELVSAGFTWLEDPLSLEHPEQYQQLANQIALPLAAGEWEQTRWGYANLLRPGGISYPQIRLSYCGGLTEAVRIRSQVHTHGLNLSPVATGTMVNIAASVHFLASDVRQPGHAEPTTGLLGIAPLTTAWNRLFSAPVRIEGGVAYVPPGPGLGIRLDRHVLESLTVHLEEITA
jgi:D-galactarolactone cycloisomerase